MPPAFVLSQDQTLNLASRPGKSHSDTPHGTPPKDRQNLDLAPYELASVGIDIPNQCARHTAPTSAAACASLLPIHNVKEQNPQARAYKRATATSTTFHKPGQLPNRPRTRHQRKRVPSDMNGGRPRAAGATYKTALRLSSATCRGLQAAPDRAVPAPWRPASPCRAAPWAVGRRVLGRQIAPALKGAARLRAAVGTSFASSFTSTAGRPWRLTIGTKPRMRWRT